ncbi:DUF6286 domain-containing protein [Nocardia sp. NPDC005978]|uniref:DUF6286 domain-containing protein n=1 Tax=Nocardia sp. NPDC005978 TaxID=3156725 RepID=UPI0033A3B403
MIRRSRRAGAAVLVALVLLALCVAVIVSLAQRLSGSGQYLSYDSVATRLHGTDWGDPVVLAVGIVLVLAGLALIAVAAAPGRAVVVPLRTLDHGGGAGIERRSLRTAVRRSVTSVPGVGSARIKMHGNTIRVSGVSDRTEVADLPDTVDRAVADAFERVGAVSAPDVRARFRPANTGGSR